MVTSGGRSIVAHDSARTCACARPTTSTTTSGKLSLSGGEPPGLSVRTTYGLRARNMRLFYRFTEAGKSVTDPAAFHEAPRLRRFYPNFLMLDFVPIEGLEVTAEYWVPESHVLAGRLTSRQPHDLPAASGL